MIVQTQIEPVKHSPCGYLHWFLVIRNWSFILKICIVLIDPSPNDLDFLPPLLNEPVRVILGRRTKISMVSPWESNYQNSDKLQGKSREKSEYQKMKTSFLPFSVTRATMISDMFFSTLRRNSMALQRRRNGWTGNVEARFKFELRAEIVTSLCSKDPAFHWRIWCYCQTSWAPCLFSAFDNKVRVVIDDRCLPLKMKPFLLWIRIFHSSQRSVKGAYFTAEFGGDPMRSRCNSVLARAVSCKLLVVIGGWQEHALIRATHWHNHLRARLWW